MNKRWIEIALVAAAALVAAIWTQNAAIAALPAVYYAAGRRHWGRLRRPSA